MRLMLLFIGLCCGYSSFSAHAFSRTGHQQICQAAYQLLSAPSRQQIDALLALQPGQSFAEGCVWPDAARNEARYRYTAPHHFINVARSANTVRLQDCAAVGCLLSALRHHGHLLATLPLNEQKRQSLLFFSHYIADLHQPLHVSYADDLGGNKTAVYISKQQLTQPEPGNLHGVWDRTLVTALGYDQATPPENTPPQPQLLLANQVTVLPQHRLNRWRSGDALRWANESLRQTRVIYQGYRPGMLIDQAVIDRDSPILQQRMQQAAVRLAWSLEQLL